MKPERLVLNPHHWGEDYIGILSDLLHGAPVKEGRNGLTNHRFGKQVMHDMRAGFPVLTTKKTFWKMGVTELLWILNGRTDLQYLHDNGVTYWDKDYKRSGRTDGTLGPVYGHQMRNFNGLTYNIGSTEAKTGVDQLLNVVKSLSSDPNGRRHLINLWNPEQMNEAALPCCWYSIQFNIDGKFMDIMWTQRSADWFLGVPMDMVMMATFLQLMAQGLNYTPRYVVGNFGDTHLYHAHFDAAREQISRQPKICKPELLSQSGIRLNLNKEVVLPQPSDFELINYEFHPAIKAELT